MTAKSRPKQSTNYWKHYFSLNILVFLLIAVMFLWMFQQLNQAPSKWTLSELKIQLEKGKSLQLGSADLFALSADKNHIQIEHDSQGKWWLSNISNHKSLEYVSSNNNKLESFKLRTLVLRKDLNFSIASSKIKVLDDKGALILQHSSPKGVSTIWFDGYQIAWQDNSQTNHKSNSFKLDNTIFNFSEPCPNSTMGETILPWWNSWMPNIFARETQAKLGGQVNCAKYLAFPELPLNTYWLSRSSNGVYQLNTTQAGSFSVCMHLDNLDPQTQCLLENYLDKQKLDLANISKIIVGHTSFVVSSSPNYLSIKPKTGVFLADEQQVNSHFQAMKEKNIGVSYQNQAINTFQLGLEGKSFDFANATSFDFWISGILFFLLLTILSVLMIRLRSLNMNPFNFIVCIHLVLSVGLILLILSAFNFSNYVHIGNLGMLIITFVSISLLILQPKDFVFNWFLSGVLLFMTVGLLLQLCLALEGQNTDAWRHWQKATLVMTFCCSLLLLLISIRYLNQQKPIGQQWRLEGRRIKSKSNYIKGWVTGGSIVTGILLLIQVVKGSELGVFDLQPVELAKLMWCLLSAFACATFLNWEEKNYYSKSDLFFVFILPCLMVMLISLIALMFLDDLSPIALVSAVLLGLIVAWLMIKRAVWTLLLLFIFFILALYLLYLFKMQSAIWLKEGLASNYSGRFNVWVDPALYPVSGYQFIKAHDAAKAGNIWGNAEVYGWSIPVVQFDFIPAYLIAKWGSVIASIVMLLQCIWITFLLFFAYDQYKKNMLNLSEDAESRWLNSMTIFSYYGFGFLMLGQMALSWGSNLGWLPVIGQPMPLIAAGNSLVLLWIFPAVLFHWFFPSKRYGNSY